MQIRYGDATLARHSREGGNPLCGVHKVKMGPRLRGDDGPFSASHRSPPQPRHSREKPALECFNRGRESIVRVYNVKMGPRFRADDDPLSASHSIYTASASFPRKRNCTANPSFSRDPTSSFPRPHSSFPRPHIRHSREKPALECFNRGRESIVRVCKVKMGPRFRGDDHPYKPR
jgi:hypothetical protein